jgi:hypothetical protein
LFGAGARGLRGTQRGVVVEVELLEHDGRMHAASRIVFDEPRTNPMVRRIVVNLTEQA